MKRGYRRGVELRYPDRLCLANVPTPLERLERTGAELGVELYVKRDDLTGAELSGNKVRKLEFLLAEARSQGATAVITCGGEQSNHCRAAALAAARVGLAARLLLRTDEPSEPPPTRANILLDRLAGAEIRWISRADWAERNALMASEAHAMRERGQVPYVIPEGGSNAMGSWGYVRCAEELSQQLAELPIKPTTIVHACGSGGTAAGLLLGAQMLDFAGRGLGIACVNVCDDRDYFQRVIGAICADFAAQFGVAAEVNSLDIIDGYVGRGYALSRPEELATLRDVARREGLVLDPVYSGKAFHGMLGELARNRGRFGERIVFVHTGGIFGLFAAADELAPLL